MSALRRRRGRPPKALDDDHGIPDLYALWNRAVASPFGIGIKSERPASLAVRLRKVRHDGSVIQYYDFVVVELVDEVRIIRCQTPTEENDG